MSITGLLVSLCLLSTAHPWSRGGGGNGGDVVSNGGCGGGVEYPRLKKDHSEKDLESLCHPSWLRRQKGNKPVTHYLYLSGAVDKVGSRQGTSPKTDEGGLRKEKSCREK